MFGPGNLSCMPPAIAAMTTRRPRDPGSRSHVDIDSGAHVTLQYMWAIIQHSCALAEQLHDAVGDVSRRGPDGERRDRLDLDLVTLPGRGERQRQLGGDVVELWCWVSAETLWQAYIVRCMPTRLGQGSRRRTRRRPSRQSLTGEDSVRAAGCRRLLVRRRAERAQTRRVGQSSKTSRRGAQYRSAAVRGTSAHLRRCCLPGPRGRSARRGRGRVHPAG